MSRKLRTAANVANLVGALAFAAFGVRYAISSLGAMLDRDAAGPNGVDPASKANGASKANSGPSAVAAGTPVRIKLVVHAKSERADVRVDGAKLGRSPYFGESSCKAGENVVVEIVPVKGAISRHERPCEPGTIRIDER